MPIYEYLCEGCGTLTELMQKVGEPPPRKCPECGSRKIAKLVSRTTFRLKGGGWYADLYSTPSKDGERKGTHAPPASADSAPAAPAPSEGEGSRPAPAAKGAAGPKASKGRRSKGS